MSAEQDLRKGCAEDQQGVLHCEEELDKYPGERGLIAEFIGILVWVLYKEVSSESDWSILIT